MMSWLLALEVGPSGFEPESNGPQPSSIGQANLRARNQDGLRYTEKGATSSISST